MKEKDISARRYKKNLLQVQDVSKDKGDGCKARKAESSQILTHMF